MSVPPSLAPHPSAGPTNRNAEVLLICFDLHNVCIIHHKLSVQMAFCRKKIPPLPNSFQLVGVSGLIPATAVQSPNIGELEISSVGFLRASCAPPELMVPLHIQWFVSQTLPGEVITSYPAVRSWPYDPDLHFTSSR